MERKPAGDGERGRVQYNYPGTFQSRYVKLAHCAAADNVTAYTADGNLRTRAAAARDAQHHPFHRETVNNADII